MKNKEQHSNGSGGWFKSLDRLTKRGKNRVKVSTSASSSDQTDLYKKKKAIIYLVSTQSDFLWETWQTWLKPSQAIYIGCSKHTNISKVEFHPWNGMLQAHDVAVKTHKISSDFLVMKTSRNRSSLNVLMIFFSHTINKANITSSSVPLQLVFISNHIIPYHSIPGSTLCQSSSSHGSIK